MATFAEEAVAYTTLRIQRLKKRREMAQYWRDHECETEILEYGRCYRSISDPSEWCAVCKEGSAIYLEIMRLSRSGASVIRRVERAYDKEETT